MPISKLDKDNTEKENYYQFKPKNTNIKTLNKTLANIIQYYIRIQLKEYILT